MGKIFVKKFLLSKSGVVNSGQDAMAYNFANGRFAVADGITNSFHPEFVAQALCKAFVDGNVAIREWVQQLNSHILDEISELWAEKVESLSLQLAGRQRRHIEMNRETLPMGSSTFAGIKCDLDKNILTYRILGDSSLFLIPREGVFSIVCSSRREERDGRRYVIYDDTPACISNFVYNCQGNPRLSFDEKWEEGELPIVPGYIVLLTDAAAEWLQDALIRDKEAIEHLWNLNSEKTFVDFVSEQRALAKMDDDLAIIILKIDSITNDGFEEIIVKTEIKAEGSTNLDEEVSVPLEVKPASLDKTTPADENSKSGEDAFIDIQMTSDAEVPVMKMNESNQQERIDDMSSMKDSTITDVSVEEKPNLDIDVSIFLVEGLSSIEDTITTEENLMPVEDALIDEQKMIDAEEDATEMIDFDQPASVDDNASQQSEVVLEVIPKQSEDKINEK